MLALRQVCANVNHQIMVKLPAEFDAYRQVEVIVLPVESTQTLSTQAFIQRFAGAMPDFPH